jgi:hypothetical protein
MDFYRWVRTQWDRAAAIVLVIAGVVSLILGYIGVSGSTLPTEQLPYLSSDGLFGIFALGVAATLWLSADLRDEWRKLDEIHRELRAARESANEDLEPAGAAPAATTTRRARKTTVSAGQD